MAVLQTFIRANVPEGSFIRFALILTTLNLIAAFFLRNSRILRFISIGSLIAYIAYFVKVFLENASSDQGKFLENSLRWLQPCMLSDLC